jgi:hypothetical protein
VLGLLSPRRRNPGVTLPGQRPRPLPTVAVPADPLAGLSADQVARLPNLIIIGAAKCGTSALHRYLAAHPEIGMSARKELKLFGSADWVQRLPDYAAQFDAAFRVRGEASPMYAMDPFVRCVPEQMAAVLPDPRFVYLVGDPVRRTLAHWTEKRILTHERRSLAESFADLEDPTNPYVATSRYGHQLGRYLEVFGADRVLVVDQDDLRTRRRETLAAVFAFAGVSPDHWSPEYETTHNAIRAKLRPNALGRFILDRAGPHPLARRLVLIRGVTARPSRRPELDPVLQSRLVEVLRPDIEAFRRLTGRPFDRWLV